MAVAGRCKRWWPGRGEKGEEGDGVWGSWETALRTSVNRHASVIFLEANNQGGGIEASEASLSRNRKFPACCRYIVVYNVAEEEVVEEEDVGVTEE